MQQYVTYLSLWGKKNDKQSSASLNKRSAHSRMSLLDDNVRLNRYTHPHSSDSNERLIRASVLSFRPIFPRDETIKKREMQCNEYGRKPLGKRMCCHSTCDIISTLIRYYCQFTDNENSMTCREPATSVH